MIDSPSSVSPDHAKTEIDTESDNSPAPTETDISRQEVRSPGKVTPRVTTEAPARQVLVKDEHCSDTEEDEDTAKTRLMWLKLKIVDRRREEAEVRMMMSAIDKDRFERVTWMRGNIADMKELKARLDGRAGLVQHGHRGDLGYHWRPMFNIEKEQIAALKTHNPMTQRRWTRHSWTLWTEGCTTDGAHEQPQQRAWWAEQEPTWRDRSEKEYNFLHGWYSTGGRSEAQSYFEGWDQRRTELLTQVHDTLTVSLEQERKNNHAKEMEQWKHYEEELRRKRTRLANDEAEPGTQQTLR